MAMVNYRALAVLTVMAMTMFQATDGTVYKVGDTAGWTTIGNIDYKQWSATKSFKLGDIVVFEYNPEFHNVMRVTHGMYKTCNASAPLATYTSGNDSMTVKTLGHHYFFCGVPGHCQAGQKLDINVLRLQEQQQQQQLAPSSSNSPATSNSTGRVFGPSINSAASFKPYFLSFLLGVFLFSFA